MPLRTRSRVPDAAVEERVGRLLLRPAVPGGWVPPQVDDDPLLQTSWSRWEEQPEPGDEPEPADEPERSWAPRGEAEPDPAVEEPASSRPRLLPATLAGGRLDPGHGGAVALLLVCLLAAVVAAGVVLRGRPQEVEVPVVEQAGTALPGVASPSPTAATEVVVAVMGEVVTPGLVRLPAGSRVDDAVRAAGGLAPGGSTGLLNLARVLVDGEQVLVGPDAQPDAAQGAPAAGAAGGLVDLNRADASALDGLPGIGPVLAERIVEWRTENGGFASVDQLREVPGIGEAKYASIKNKVSV